MNIIVDEEVQLDKALTDKLTEAAVECVSGEELEPDRVEISLSIVSKDEIKDLNNDFRGIDRVTDVLSFPQYDDLTDVFDNETICLGDVVICDEVAAEQAIEYGHSKEREFVYLFVHSVLHLLGYDHMEDDQRQEMRKREEEVMTHVGLQRVV